MAGVNPEEEFADNVKAGDLAAYIKVNTPYYIVKTLECYLRSFKRHSAVSEKLGLHRNTVINRIKRIEGILNMDISAGGSLSKLLLGIDMHGLSAGDGEAEYVR